MSFCILCLRYFKVKGDERTRSLLDAFVDSFFYPIVEFTSISDKFARALRAEKLQPGKLDSSGVNKIYENNQGKNQNKDFNHIECHFFI